MAIMKKIYELYFTNILLLIYDAYKFLSSLDYKELLLNILQKLVEKIFKISIFSITLVVFLCTVEEKRMKLKKTAAVNYSHFIQFVEH